MIQHFYLGIYLTRMCACVQACMLSHPVMSDPLPPHRLQPARLLCPWGFSRQEYWSGLSCLPSGDLPNPGIEPRSPTLQTDSLLSEPPGKPKNTGVGSLSLFQAVFLTQESNRHLLHCRWIIYQDGARRTANTNIAFGTRINRRQKSSKNGNIVLYLPNGLRNV